MSGRLPGPNAQTPPDTSFLDALANVRARQQKNIYEAAENMNAAVKAAIGELAARIPRAVPGMGPLKKEADAKGKVQRDYASDWYSIKDIVRGTVAVDTLQQAEELFRAAKRYFVASNGWGILETKEPRRPPVGYTDWKIVITRQGSPAEVQINTKNMLLAKDLPFLQNNCMAEWRQLSLEYQAVPVGLGHALYEVARTNPGTDIATQYGNVAVAYYAYFRSDPPNYALGLAAKQALAAVPANPDMWPIKAHR